jgi:glycerol uptake operon antiterminator
MTSNFSPIIAALWDPKLPLERLRRYGGNTVFILKSDIVGLRGQVKTLKKTGYRVFVDIDFVSGLSGDDYGLRFIMLQNVDGIITIKPRLIETARKYAFPAILRSFALDSSALIHLHETITTFHPEIVEILPGCAFPKAYAFLLGKHITPFPVFISAGLVDNVKEVRFLLQSGAKAVSSSAESIWEETLTIEKEVEK